MKIDLGSINISNELYERIKKRWPKETRDRVKEFIIEEGMQQLEASQDDFDGEVYDRFSKRNS